MRFTAAAFLALATAVLAQVDGFDPITKPAEGSKIQAGTDFEIVWEPSDAYNGTVTITLIGGPSQPKQVEIDVLAKSIDNSVGSYDWAVDDSLGEEKVYGLRISLDSDPENIFQYSFPFAILPASGGSSATSSATSTGSSGNETASATASSYPTSKTSASPSYTASSNYTTSAPAPTDVTITTTPTASPTSGPTTVPSNPAGTVAASSLALVGGLAMAIFAL